MAGKLINTLKYGSSRTKRKIYLLFGILAAGVVLTTAALIAGNAMLGLLAFTVIFVDGLILFNTSFESKTMETPVKEKKQKKKKTKEDGPGALEWISSDKKEKQAEKVEMEDEEENPLVQYDEKKLKKIMVAYKVRKHHVPVMIDSSQSEKIQQCPAYVWKDSTYLYFLLLEKEPRMIKSPLRESSEIHIRRGMTARPTEEYPDMQEDSLISRLFAEFLPKYYTVDKDAYRTEYRKNLYSAAPGIWCTTTSVKNLLKLLPANFVLDDGKIDNENSYYQEIYIARVMYWDGIYTGQEYKEKVLEVLGNLAKAEISEGMVQQYLYQMMQKGLIPREYADYVISKRK